MDDTVEKKVEGMAEAIIEEDQQRRAQDLVSTPDEYVASVSDMLRRTCLILPPSGRTGT